MKDKIKIIQESYPNDSSYIQFVKLLKHYPKDWNKTKLSKWFRIMVSKEDYEVSELKQILSFLEKLLKKINNKLDKCDVLDNIKVKISPKSLLRQKRQLANSLVFQEIRNGKLLKNNCEICNSTFSHAHHENYDKPLDVRWLCPKHHMELHQTLKNKKYTKNTLINKGVIFKNNPKML